MSHSMNKKVKTGGIGTKCLNNTKSFKKFPLTTVDSQTTA